MTNLLKKLSIGLMSATLLGASATTAVFADSTIEGNGASSINTITVSSTCKSSVNQSNSTSVNTNVSVSADTGGNQASYNTGSGVSIGTGDATAGVSVSVEGGSNEATAPDCCLCTLGGTDQAIVENGASSINTVHDTFKQHTSVTQKNKTHVTTLALLKAKTGKNKANYNTGGSTEVTTGDASAGVEVTVTSSSNTTL